MNESDLRPHIAHLERLNEGLAQQILSNSDRLEESRRELLAIGWESGFNTGGELAAWAIGNRPEVERPSTDNPYRRPIFEATK